MFDAEALKQINERRAAKGAGPLTVDPLLKPVAINAAIDMIQRNYFNATTPEGQSLNDRTKAAGFTKPVYPAIAKNTENPSTNPKDPPGMARFMLDSAHTLNATNVERLYNPQFNVVGIGTVYRKVPSYTLGYTTYQVVLLATK